MQKVHILPKNMKIIKFLRSHFSYIHGNSNILMKTPAHSLCLLIWLTSPCSVCPSVRQTVCPPNCQFTCLSCENVVFIISPVLLGQMTCTFIYKPDLMRSEGIKKNHDHILRSKVTFQGHLSLFKVKN